MTNYGERNANSKYLNELTALDHNKNEKTETFESHTSQQRDIERNPKNPFRHRNNKFGSKSSRSSNKIEHQFDPTKQLKEASNQHFDNKDTMMNNRKKHGNDDRELSTVKLPSFIESLPPRLQKQYLIKHGIDPNVLNKPHEYKSDNNHQIQYRTPIDRVRDNSALRNSPERHDRRHLGWQQDHQLHDRNHQSLIHEKDRSGYVGYSYDSRRPDKINTYKADKSNSIGQSRSNKYSTDVGHFSNSRSITYDRSAHDHSIRITKKVDWPDSYSDNDASSGRNSAIGRHTIDNYPNNHFEHPAARDFHKNIGNLSSSPSSSTGSCRSTEPDRVEYHNMRYERSSREKNSMFDAATTNQLGRGHMLMKKTPTDMQRLSPPVERKLTQNQDNQMNTEVLKHESTFKDINYRDFYVRPNWYLYSESHNKPQTRNMINRLEQADTNMQRAIDNDDIFKNWQSIDRQREAIQKLFEQFLVYEMKLCREENAEQHFWKILFYNFFELFKGIRKSLPTELQAYCNEKAIELVENGLVFFEQLIQILETSYKFKLNDFIGTNAGASIKGMKFQSLAIVSAQKICLFLGDLYRYREQFLNTKNFGKAKQWYIKAQQLVPANGIPYNQLAVLSLYTKRKFDAVYYHTRSLTSSNPIYSAKESLKVLFDEIRKKYETGQLKNEKRKKESNQQRSSSDPLRQEIWIHPCGGPKIYRTAALNEWQKNAMSSGEDEYKGMDSIELSKRFTTSYLHVHGKLITKIGMDSFMPCATQLLKEFRILLHHTPIVLTSERLIQLMVLNMFAIDSASTPGPNEKCRSEIQDFALSLSMSMFGIILEKFLSILNDLTDEQNVNNAPFPQNASLNSARFNSSKIADTGIDIVKLPEDAKVILPSIKVWCHWLVCYMKLWKCPPACIDDATSRNPWHGLDVLGLLIDKSEINESLFTQNQQADFSLIRLPEDIALLGFTILPSSAFDRTFCSPDEDTEVVQNMIRFKMIDLSIQFVRSQNNLTTLQTAHVANNYLNKTHEIDLLVESLSDNEEYVADTIISEKLYQMSGLQIDEHTLALDACTDEKSAEIQKLLQRKDELQRHHKMQEKHNQRLQEILNQRPIQLKIEIRPKYIVPDTNCYIDFLDQIKLITAPYYIVVPLVVMNELEGLSRGAKLNVQRMTPPLLFDSAISQLAANSSAQAKDNNSPPPPFDQLHNAKVATAAQLALVFLKSKNFVIKFCTTKGSFLKSGSFTMENDDCDKISNDDKILLTASNLCKNHIEEQRGETQFIVREVVLLTTDRNLRVKALSQNVPVREVPGFIKWSGLSD